MNNLHVDAPIIRPASVEPPRINQELLREPDTRPEFGAYWKKAHLILRSIPQVKGKGRINIWNCLPWVLNISDLFFPRK